MDLLNDYKDLKISKTQQEQVQQEKQEYYLLGTYLRTKGLKVFFYNPIKQNVEELEIKYSDTIHLVPRDGKLIPIDYENEKCQIDSRNIYFEALNLNSAKKRVIRFKQGKIKELCNLKKYNPDATIKFY